MWNDIMNWLDDGGWCLLLIVALVGGLIWLFVWMGVSAERSSLEFGTITEKVFVPSSSGVGVGITSSGKSAIVSNYTAEKYLIIFQMNDGSYDKVEVKEQSYFPAKVGQHIRVKHRWYGADYSIGE